MRPTSSPACPTWRSGQNPLGISAQNPLLDLAKTIAWKDGIVGRLNNGVAGLLKKAGVKVLVGWATFRDGKTVEVATETRRAGRSVPNRS